mmetsp:Transcript_13208/g.28635  ORF Transcript_13208/g.28635 Transcript_13208/m.28635 type:complete len:82 (+) Transcript_13208:90-335(+)
MFLLNDIQGANQGVSEADLLMIPPPDATTLELIHYNINRLKHRYLGTEPEARKITLKLIMNVTAFSVACIGINQFGDKFAI